MQSFFTQLFAAGAAAITALVLRLFAVLCLIWIAFDAPIATAGVVAGWFVAWLLTRTPGDPTPLPGEDR